MNVQILLHPRAGDRYTHAIEVSDREEQNQQHDNDVAMPSAGFIHNFVFEKARFSTANPT